MDFISKLFKTPNKNGNLCERAAAPALEAIAAKSPNGEVVTASPTQFPAEQLAEPEGIQPLPSPDKEEDNSKSQALTDTNSASFVSLSTLSQLSESALSAAPLDQSRPKSADTDSLDYESADEVASARTGPETPAEEDGDEVQNGGADDTLGLDALTSKLSSLYLSSPNPAKKPPAFHSEPLDDSESEVSFNVSVSEVEVIANSLKEDKTLVADSPVLSTGTPTTAPELVVLPVQIQTTAEEQPTEKHEVLAPTTEPEVEPSALPETPKEKELEDSAPAEISEEAVIEQLKAVSLDQPKEEVLEHSNKEVLEQPKEEVSELPKEAVPEEPKEEIPEPPTEELSEPPTEELSEQLEEAAPEQKLPEHTEELAEATQQVEAEAEVIPQKATEAAEPEAPAEEEFAKQHIEIAAEPQEKAPEPEVVEVELTPEVAKEEPLPVTEAPTEKEPPVSEVEGPVPEPVKELELQEPKEPEIQKVEEPVPELETPAPEVKAPVPELPELQPVVIAPEEKPEPLIPQAEQAPEEKHLVELEKSLPEATNEQNSPAQEPAPVAEKPVAEVAPVVVAEPEIAEEPPAEVSFEEPTPLEAPAPLQPEPTDFVIEFVTKPKPVRIETEVEKQLPVETDWEPEKEVSVEKPITKTQSGSLSALLNLCQQQQRILDQEEETETDGLEQLLEAEANLVCAELNASLDTEPMPGMADQESPLMAPPRRSRSPRKSSPSRDGAMEGSNHSLMNSSNESAIASARHFMGKSTDSVSPKSLRSLDSGICGAEANQSEAGPETAEQFVPATEDLFKNPADFDFLSKFGGDSAASRLERESLYVKFDPLVGNRDRRVFLSPCVEASPRTEDQTEDTPAPARPQPDTPLTSRHAVGPLVQIATPVLDEKPAPKNESSKSKAEDLESQAVQEMIVLLKRESEELKKLLRSQGEDYEAKTSAMQAKLKQKTEAEEQMSLVMKEYEDTISRILAEKEKALEKSAEEKKRLTDELAIIQSDLSAAEVAFSDLHRKYERAKAAIEVFKSNENTLKQSNVQFQEQIKQAEKKYLVLKSHAEDKLEEAARENEGLVKASEMEVSALRAQNAQLKARNTTLVETLGMRERENQELMTICDDLVQKLGAQGH